MYDDAFAWPLLFAGYQQVLGFGIYWLELADHFVPMFLTVRAATPDPTSPRSHAHPTVRWAEERVREGKTEKTMRKREHIQEM